MSDWAWFQGEPRGKCPSCQEFLRRPDVLVQWRTRVYHVGCLLDLTTAVAPADPYVYQNPAEDWRAP